MTAFYLKLRGQRFVRFIICFTAAGALASGYLYAAKEKNVIRLGRHLTIDEGRVVRSAATIVGDIKINGTVEDDVVAVGGSVTIGPKAVVAGNVVSIGGIIDKHKKANVSGNLVEASIPGFSTFAKTQAYPNWRKIYWVFRFISFFGLIILALVTAMVIPKAILMVSSRIETTPVNAVSWSIRGMLLIVPLAVILTMSLAGILLIPLEAIIVVGMTLFGYFAAAHLIGKKIVKLLMSRNEHIYIDVLVGITLLTFIGLIPFVGWITRAIVALIGLGGVLACLFGNRKLLPFK